MASSSEPPRKIHVQTKDGESKLMTEHKVRNALRERELSGLEMVRFDDDEKWQPLYELPLFREVVPVIGDPRDTARRREIRGVLGHATGFAIATVVMLAVFGTLPWWLGLWLPFLILHAAKVAPTALQLHREGKSLFLDEAEGDAPAALDASSADRAAPRASSLDQEVREVRSLIESEAPEGKEALLATVDELRRAVEGAERRERDLEAQVSEEEQRALERELEEARENLRSASGSTAEVFRRQVEVLESRQRSIEEAVSARAALLAQKSVAMNQLKQLRLDLSRARADERGLPDLGARLEDIRLEMAAAREVDELLKAGAESGAEEEVAHEHSAEHVVGR